MREREFIDAARTLGFGRFRIIFSEILPNLSSTLIVFFALQLAQSIVLEAALSFLGAGVQPPNASWGTMLAERRRPGHQRAAPHAGAGHHADRDRARREHLRRRPAPGLRPARPDPGGALTWICSSSPSSG